MRRRRSPRRAPKPRRSSSRDVERGRVAAKWIELCDPSPDEVRAQAPRELEESAFELLTAEPQHADEPRPTLQSHGDYVFGLFLLAVVVPDEDDVFYQQVGLVITREEILTVCKTPPGGRRPPYDTAEVRKHVRDD